MTTEKVKSSYPLNQSWYGKYKKIAIKKILKVLIQRITFEYLQFLLQNTCFCKPVTKSRVLLKIEEPLYTADSLQSTVSVTHLHFCNIKITPFSATRLLFVFSENVPLAKQDQSVCRTTFNGMVIISIVAYSVSFIMKYYTELK